MSNEVILNLSFDNQTVTDLTGNWTLDGTPNATYEQIEGRDGYSIVTGSLGRCIVLNAVDQNAVYNEYTVDFDMFVKSTYTSDYYIYTVIYMWSLINPGSEYSGEIGNVLNMSLKIGGSEPVGTTNYSPIGRWVHVTFTSGPTEVDDQYCTTVYVDGVKLLDRTDIDVNNNPFALSQQIIPLARDTDAKLMPNGPGICLNTFKVVEGIHMPNQNPAISLFNLSRVFNNFCTWLKRQLSTVAFTGSYNDLSNKPTISTVNDGTLTIQQNGTNVQTFTANASTNKTANIQCVDLSTAQTIGGVKTFSDGLFASKSGQGDLVTLEDSSINSTNEDANGMPLTGHTNSVKIKGSQFNVIPCMLTGQLFTSGDTSAELRTYKYKDNTSSAMLSLRYIYASNSGFVQFKNISFIIPNVTNTSNLGSASLQWNTTYTRNILIDNDINIASSLINKTSTSGVISIRGGLNTQDGASIGLYGKDYNGGIAGNIYMTAYGNSDYTNFRIYPNGTISVYNNSTATTKNVAMQEDVVNLTSNQTIGGVKTFTSNMVIQGSKKVTCNLDNSFIELDGGTTWGKGGSIVLSGQDRSSYTNSVLIVSKSDTNTDILQYQNGELKPHPNNTNNSSLGTSTSKWKSFNGINPGALSLPSISSTGANAWIALDTTNWVKSIAVSSAQKYTPLADGWLNVRVDNATMLAIAVGGNYMHQVIRSETANSLALLMPVFKNTEVAIMTGGNENLAYNRVTFYYCQGNV